jgi:hypothetical protein
MARRLSRNLSRPHKRRDLIQYIEKHECEHGTAPTEHPWSSQVRQTREAAVRRHA